MKPIEIVHMLPDLLNLYGDGGNVLCLAKRCAWRGIPVHVQKAEYSDTVTLAGADIVFLGGGPDREQKLASGRLFELREELHRYVEDDGVLLAICGGFQILGSEWVLGSESVEGLGIVDIMTKRPHRGAARLIDDIAISNELATHPIIGYENHAGRTFLGKGVKPFGVVISSTGHGNNDDDKVDGVRYRNVIGSYLHGPLLSKNPEIADHLLQAAANRRIAAGIQAPVFEPLDNAAEFEANAYMAKRLGIR